MVRTGRLPNLLLPDPLVPVPMPPQAQARESLVELPGTRVWCWDTGGRGEAVVLMHPASGSALVWGYQQPVLAAAGYRVIGWSRRGHYGSDPVPADDPGSASSDLHALLDRLGIGRFHAVASAAGCAVTMDYALSHPGRLASIVWSCGLGGMVDTDYAGMLERLRPKAFGALPIELQELGPSYRAANPEGVRAWVELHGKAYTGNRLGQRPVNTITLAALQRLRVPTLLMAGDADLWWPPAALRIVAAHLPMRETLLVAEAGHSAHWETPELFNRAVLDFIGRHRAAGV